MTKQSVTNLAAAIIVAGGVALARPAQAAQELFNCMDSHAEAVEAGAEMCGSLGYDYATVTTTCTDNTATGSSVRCHN